MRSDTRYPTAQTMQTLPAVPLRRYILFAVLAVGGCSLDLATKHIAFARLLWGEPYWLWPGHAGFQLSLNGGALFGIGQGKVSYFAILSVIAAVAIPVWLFVYRVANDLWMTLALGGVTGGILGNLYDRLGLHNEVWRVPDPRAGEPAYAVRDWILWQYNDRWVWPNFNIADALLVVGSAIIFLRVLCEPTSPAARAEPTASQPARESQ